MVFQDPDVQLFSPTVWDEVTFGPLQLKIPGEEVASRANQALALLDISHLKERPPYLLSGGEKKKVSLACVLSMQPQVLLLDEPTSGLDPRSQGKLIDFLLEWSSAGNSLIFSSQELDMVEEIASRLIVLGEGHRIEADGPPEEFLCRPGFPAEDQPGARALPPAQDPGAPPSPRLRTLAPGLNRPALTSNRP